MGDIFNAKTARPMLIGANSAAFDDEAYFYELKLDGERCLAYLDPAIGTTALANTKNRKLLPLMPELADMHTHVREKCILDGELVVMQDGKPDFEAMKNRWLLSNRLRIEVAAKATPISFVAFDILYLGSAAVVDEPLYRRKQLLAGVVAKQDSTLSVARYIECEGTALFEAAVSAGLEGVVAKQKDSPYRMGKRTRNWRKVKNTQDDEFVVCGYIREAQHVASLVLGQYSSAGTLLYKGHVTVALNSPDFARVEKTETRGTPPFSGVLPPGNENVVWVEPSLVCTVQFLHRTPAGGIRNPVFKGLRQDKTPQDVVAEMR